MRSGTLILIAVLAASTLALPKMFQGRRRVGKITNTETIKPDTGSAVSGAARIEQRVDHFNDADNRAWYQKYFFNQQYSSNKDVNFLYISGEQTDSMSTITGDRPIVQYAAQFGASLYALEHRFYGDSHPLPDSSIDSLKYLSSRQAIEDIAEFIKQMNNRVTTPQKWIVVGGSYAGNLAAWARLKHPELIAGAISSSAPLLAQLNFYGYLATVEKDFKALGGNCATQLEQAITKAVGLFESKNGLAQLDTLFNIKPPLAKYADVTDNDMANFFSYLTSPFEDSAQYSNPPPADLCKTFTNHPAGYDPLQALADLVWDQDGIDVGYNSSVQFIKREDFDDEGEYTTRLWVWQTCTEFGYFQTTDTGSNIFQSTQPSNIFLNYCKDIFGIDVDAVKANIDATNKYYGERDYFAGTNVLFSYGTQDPWSWLCKQSGSQHWSVVIVELPGGSHCSDLHSACDDNGQNCNPNLLKQQQLAIQKIDSWLNGPYSVPDSVTLSDQVGKRPQWYDDFVPPPLSIKANSPNAVARSKRAVETPKRQSGRLNAFLRKRKNFLLPPPPPMEKSFGGRPDDWPINIETGWVDQPWDHFDPNNEKLFKQRFFVNEKFGTTAGPNFLMIGGEGPESASWVTNEDLAWMTYAKAAGATVYILEHRYYGDSKLGTTDLQYLSSAQMLYDVARFIQIVKRDRQATGPWITFGGSYPGALAAWSREWFPDLILGSVGSSGPVLAKNDFFEYLQVVENVLQSYSQSCSDRTADAFDQLRQQSHTAQGRSSISKKFNVQPPWNSTDTEIVSPMSLQNVFSALYGAYQGVVQYSDDNNGSGRKWNVSQLCDIMNDVNKYPNSIDAVRAVAEWSYDMDNFYISSDAYADLDELKDMIKYIDGHDNGNKYSDDDLSGVLWTWQTCNEFGYYQTTDYGSGIFGNPVPLNYFIEMCEYVFGSTMDHIEAGVARSNYQYGGRDRYSATNVVLPNGNHDPWHALGILKQGDLDASVVPIVIEGTAHCADMYPARDQDLPQLTNARTQILANIQKWLGQQAPTQPPPPTTQKTDEDTDSSTQLLSFTALVVLLAAYLF